MKFRHLLLSLLLMSSLSGVVSAATFEETRKLAEQGYAQAQYHMGLIYANGDGVPQNNMKAYIWTSLAKAQGDGRAKKNIEILKERMTHEQIAEAQTIAARCFESNYKNCD